MFSNLRTEFFYILIFQISFNATNLTNHHFCIKQQHHHVYCGGNYTYDCMPDKCSVDKTACDHFRSLTFANSYIRTMRTNNAELMKFIEFKRLMKSCPVLKYAWRVDDFCFNRNQCARYEYNVMIGMKEKVFTDCQCKGKYLHKCTKKICSTDKNACNHFKIKKKSPSLYSKMTECQTGSIFRLQLKQNKCIFITILYI